VLDDFEQNIPQENVADGSLRLTAEAYRILQAIFAALKSSARVSRVIITCRYLKEDTLTPHNLHLESLAKMPEADISKKCRLLQQEDNQRFLNIADGNPRLLEWLVAVLKQPDLNQEELWTRLEAVEAEFRENILAQVLLSAVDDEKKKDLARLSVFELPVTEDVGKAVFATSDSSARVTNHPTAGEKKQAEPAKPPYQAQPGNENNENTEPLALLTSLSLIESATTHPHEPKTYRVPAILAPLLQPLLTPEEWHATRVQAVKTIYQLWWEDSDSSTTEQRREIIRLGLLAQEKEVTVKVGDATATGWINRSRFSEALLLCEEILDIFPDYRIWGTIARAEETLGMVEAAVSHYQLALELCPEDDIERKAANLHNMAGIYAQQGEVSRAIALYTESLQLKETIGDVQGKAASLHQLAGIYAQQGDVSRAIALYTESLQLKETIGDVQGKAASLHQLAGIYAQQGEVSRAIALYTESLQLDETIGDVQGKAATLANMAFLAGEAGDKARQLELNIQAAQTLAQAKAYIDLQGRQAESP
jgi:tetratricopeptide (TPR) repeat protein